MKTCRILLTALMVLFFTACREITMSTRSVEGNKNVVTRERTAGNFSAIKVSAGIDVYLSQGDRQAITVEADENLHDYIMTEVRDDVLHVYTDVNIRDAEMKRVYVALQEVTYIETSSAGDVIGETPVNSDELRLSASSAGNITLEVHAKTVNADISSSGDIILSGDADILRADVSSAGDLKAFDLRVREAGVLTSSAGSAEINVSEKLTAKASSAGDINYIGDARIIDAYSSSAGGVHKK